MSKKKLKKELKQVIHEIDKLRNKIRKIKNSLLIEQDRCALIASRLGDDSLVLDSGESKVPTHEDVKKGKKSKDKKNKTKKENKEVKEGSPWY